jgi:hypothetical protein
MECCGKQSRHAPETASATKSVQKNQPRHTRHGSEQEKAGSYGTNYGRFAHDALGLPRTKNVRQSREKQRGDHVREDRGWVGHGRIVVAKRKKINAVREGAEGEPRLPPAVGAVFEEAEADEAFGSGDNGLFVRAGRPAEQAPGFFVGGILLLAKFGQDNFYRRITE